jgi:glycosyltransferase involved in cell wall biosynthesis
MNIAFISREVEGLDKNGGIGTATRYICEHLAYGGAHEINLYHTGSSYGDDAGFAQTARSLGIQIHYIHADDNAASPCERRPWQTYRILRDTGHDLYVFHDFMADGFFCFLARESGTAFQKAALGVLTHGSSQWVDEANSRKAGADDRVLLYAMEKTCCELADFLVSPSAYLLGWMREQGWTLPAICRNIPNFTSPPGVFDPVLPRPHISSSDIRELVFFGRLEERKGIRVFCEALNALPSELLSGCAVTFLGKQDHFNARAIRALLRPALQGAGITTNFYHDYNAIQAREYLCRPGRLAVMPSLLEVSGCVISECLEKAVPFLTSSTGGGKELIQQEDWEATLFHPDRNSLAETLTRILGGGGAVTPRPFYTHDSILAGWRELFRKVDSVAQKQSRESHLALFLTLYGRHVDGGLVPAAHRVVKKRLRDVFDKAMSLIPSTAARQQCVRLAKGVARRPA